MQPLSVKQSLKEDIRPLHPATEVGAVTLKVANLGRALDFYTGTIGLQILSHEGSSARLGAGKRLILTLTEMAGAPVPPAFATGLYHAAILLPDRHSLAVKIAQIAATQYPLGYADHLVSEAFYLSDPDENGLELYRDRPRQEWTWEGGRVKMASDAIDFDSFFAEIKGEDITSVGPTVPDGTKLGHMHLRVADIDNAEAFYHGILGFDVIARLPGALFVSAGGYHHHIGMNTWESRGGRPAAQFSTGLAEFSIVLPNAAELERLSDQVEASGAAVQRSPASASFLDPSQNRIRLVVRDNFLRI
jgi:catechol 2,3-dioxygenase